MIDLKKENAILAARWHIENLDGAGKCQVTEDSFIMVRPHAKFYAVCAGSPAVKLSAEKLPLPDSPGVFPYVNCVTQAAAAEALVIMVSTSFQPDQENPRIEIAAEDNDWLVTMEAPQKKLRVKLIDQGTLPEFEVTDARF